MKFDILDDDGVHSYGSSSRLIKLDVDSYGRGIGFSRETLVFFFGFIHCSWVLQVAVVTVMVQEKKAKYSLFIASH